MATAYYLKITLIYVSLINGGEIKLEYLYDNQFLIVSEEWIKVQKYRWQ